MHIPFVKIVKLQSLDQFSVDHFSHPVRPHLPHSLIMLLFHIPLCLSVFPSSFPLSLSLSLFTSLSLSRPLFPPLSLSLCSPYPSLLLSFSSHAHCLLMLFSCILTIFDYYLTPCELYHFNWWFTLKSWWQLPFNPWSIQSDFNSAVVWMVFFLPLISSFDSLFLQTLRKGFYYINTLSMTLI